MEQIVYQHDYAEYKQQLRSELERTSEGFVRIGYLLKVARDTDILKTSGYSDYLDFANGEFGLDKSMVSRFIRINDRFSEEGNSDRLLEQYKGFGYAKLALMLRIPEVITEELTPEYTKSEIQQIKEELDEERNKTEIEHLEENFEQIMNPPEDSLLVRVLKAIGEENAVLYCKIWNFFSENTDWNGLKEIFKPVEQMTYVARVPGEGRVVLIVKEDSASLTIARTETKTNHSWDEIKSAWAEIMPVSNGEEGHSFIKAKDAYEYTYGKPIAEEKPEVAPVQPKRVEVPKKEAPKKAIKEPETVKAEPADVCDEETERQCCDPEPEEAEVSGLIKNDESEVEEVKGEIIEDEEDEVDPRGQLIVNTQVNINRAKFFIDEEVKHINSKQQILTENLIKCKQELEKAIREIEEVIR